MDVSLTSSDLLAAILVATRAVAAVLEVMPTILPVLVVTVVSTVVPECAERAVATADRGRRQAPSRAR